MADRDERLEELGRLWREQEVEPHAFDAKEVLMQVKQQARKFDRTIRWRDVREAIAGAFVLTFAGWSSWSAEGWLPKAGFLALAVCGTYTVARALRARRQHPQVREDQPLVDRLQAEVRKVEAQAELLRTVRSWYILPIAIGTTVWRATLVNPTGGLIGLLSEMGLVLVAGAAIFSLVGWGVWKLNQHALRSDLQPRLSELRDMLEEARVGQA